MDSQRVANWIQIATAVSVIVGLGLVVFELRQTKELARYQIEASLTSMGLEREAMVPGDELAETLARLHDPAAPISDADLVRFDAYAFAYLREMSRAQQLALYGLLPAQDKGDLVTVCWYFGHDVGRAWLNGPSVPQDQFGLLDHYRDQVAQCDDQPNYIEFMRRSLSRERNVTGS